MPIPCDIKPNKTNYFVPEKHDFDDFEVDQTVLIRAKDLTELSFVDYKKVPEEYPIYDKVYPGVNAYYCHTEDADPLSKVNSLLAQPHILKSNKENNLERRHFIYDGYSEKEAHSKYLESKPVSFLILGKPDIGQQELGKQLAYYWNCVYIEPQVLIEEEIESSSRAGGCIDFNLRCGRAIGIDIILKLVENRVKSENAKHRGFVLCGLPLIANDLYEEDPMSSQSAIFTAKDIFEEVFRLTTDFYVAPSNPHVSVSSKYQSESEASSAYHDHEEAKHKTDHLDFEESIQEINIGKDYEKQLDFLFNLLEHPYFIIYVHCGTIDALNKRDSYRYDLSSNQIIDVQRRSYNYIFRDRFINEYDKEAKNFYETSIEFDSEDLRLNNLVKLPRDFKAPVSSQLDQYYYAALNFIQNRVIAHKSEYIIKVDGRTSISIMLNIVKAKLKVMNVQQVLNPKKLTDDFETEVSLLGEDQDTSRDDEESKNVTHEEYFKKCRKKFAPNASYPLSWSEWGTICPVSLKMGYAKQGSVKFAVQFLNKMYFLTDQEAYLKFYQNPRLFLLPAFPRPTCRIFIFGPEHSGRSALAQCLAYYLDGTALSAEAIMHECMQERHDKYLQKIRQQAITEGIALLNKNRRIQAEENEKIRVEQIKEWAKTVVGLFEKMSDVLDEIEKEKQQEKFEISSFPMAMKKAATTDDLIEESEEAALLFQIREQLHELNVPIQKLDVPTWKSLLNDRRKLLQYLPPDLAQKRPVKPATVSDDFVKEYVAAALANAGLADLQLNEGNIVQLFINHMRIAEKKYQEQGLGRGGWVIDGMFSNIKILQDFFPDYTADDIIVLQDKTNYLVKNYEQRKTTFFNDFRSFFANLNLHDAARRSPSGISTQDYKEGFAKSILNEILEDRHFYDQPEVVEGIDMKADLRVEGYKKNIQKFQNDWEKVRKFYLDNNISPMEIDVSGKTLTELFEFTIKSIDSKYTYSASKITEEDRAEEVTQFGYQKVKEHSAAEDPTQNNIEEKIEVLRKYGDTLHFCPVTFAENFVLWKGEENFAVKYNEKIYLLATEPDMEKFIQDPRKFLPQGYPAKLPPLRICVIGVKGCGKTYLSKSISENYGLIYLSFEQCLKKSFNIFTNETLSELSTNSKIVELRSYLNNNGPFPKKMLDKLKMYWFNEPFKTQGFVFDDFPKNPEDVDFMVKNKLIPDLILYPHADGTYLKTKFLEIYLKWWQEEMEKRNQEFELKYSKALEKWREKRSARFNELIEERREKRHLKKLENLPELQQVSPEIKNTSLVSFDSVADQEDIDDVNKVLDLELPPIAYETPEQNSELFISKTQPLISSRIETYQIIVKHIKEKCLKHRIRFQEIPLDLDHLNKTKLASFFAIQPIKFRNLSYLESCYDVPLEIADTLLTSGYIFLSKFGKTCPVQYYENELPIQMYQVAESNKNLFPVIHRSYIYFIVGDKQRNLFKSDPLKYINQDFRFPLLKHKVAVIGPPKCGKTILSERIQKEFGFKLITRGQAVRYVLKYLFQSDLAKNMESVLRKGWELTDEMVIKSVEAATFDASAGVVFDGFPNGFNETKHLAYMDLIPNLIIELEATQIEVLDCLSAYIHKSDLPKFGPKFALHLYEGWLKEAKYFGQWFDKEYQAMTKIPINTSNWSVWYKSKAYLLSTFSEINHYHTHILEDWPLRLGNMLVTPLEFLERQSSFKSFCPVCLHFSNSLVTGGDPPDRTGVIQFRDYFYWLCHEHIELFLKCPEIYLPPYNNHGLPANLPKRASFGSRPDNIYEDGACAVCHKSKRIITKGLLRLAATFNDKAYLFDTVNCLNTFMKNPQSFQYGFEFHAPVYPSLKYRELPILGMLEQYIARYIIKGLSFIAKRRPVIPGLDIPTSALVGLGLFIKVKNDAPHPLKSFYEEGFRLYNERRDNLLKYLDVMKTYRNPYLHYQEPLPEFQLPPATPKIESLTTMMSRIVDQCVHDIDTYLHIDFTNFSDV